ncbi:hypothetical protein, partial [Escherichia coli]|uniref:hypothetical protein n=1 Tax=Escherichia coli TaxID=562 RepID=UPI00197AECCC
KSVIRNLSGIYAASPGEWKMLYLTKISNGDLTIYDQIIADVWNHISRIDRLKGIIESTLAECEERHKKLKRNLCCQPRRVEDVVPDENKQW